jgi:hypothetical protein
MDGFTAAQPCVTEHGNGLALRGGAAAGRRNPMGGVTAA